MLLSNLAYLTTPRKGDKCEDPIKFKIPKMKAKAQ